MFSEITKAKAKLPLDFIQEIYADLGNKNAERCLEGMCKKRYVTLRVNRLKSERKDIENFFKDNNVEYESVPFYEDAFIIKNKSENELQKFDIYKEGKIYLQSLSSMIPAIVLGAEEGDKVLDLTAAPGSKTTQIAALCENKVDILANEIDKIRCERLKYNINLQGAKAEVINEDGINIGEKYQEQFDKVLLDAPCSGEGRFLLNKNETYSKWSIKMKDELSKTQKLLLESAIKATKQNGVIVYSTCTLNKKEDEQAIEYALKNFNVKLASIELKIKNTIKVSHNNNEKSLKIIPNEIMEGFYVAKLIKM